MGRTAGIIGGQRRDFWDVFVCKTILQEERNLNLAECIF